MKNFTLVFFTLLIFNWHDGQNVVWSDNFDDEDINDWTLIDSDGDTNNWGDLFQITDGGGTPVTPISLISRSWQGDALFPDNWAVSPAIDLSGASGTITVDWITQVAAQPWDEEKYSVYVGTSSDITVLENSQVALTQILGDAGNTGTPTAQSLDISSLAGESTVYIAFRHWDCTDEDFLSVDDLAVNAQTLSIDEFALNSFNYFFNNTKNELVLNSSDKNFTNLKVYSILGQSVTNRVLNNSTETIDLSELNDGVYLAKINIDSDSKTIKFIKY
ncbi:MAG: T9SS type A sorting domain-containing protein [Bacteroidota bacterium]